MNRVTNITILYLVAQGMLNSLIAKNKSVLSGKVSSIKDISTVDKLQKATIRNVIETKGTNIEDITFNAASKLNLLQNKDLDEIKQYASEQVLSLNENVTLIHGTILPAIKEMAEEVKKEALSSVVEIPSGEPTLVYVNKYSLTDKLFREGKLEEYETEISLGLSVDYEHVTFDSFKKMVKDGLPTYSNEIEKFFEDITEKTYSKFRSKFLTNISGKSDAINKLAINYFTERKEAILMWLFSKVMYNNPLEKTDMTLNEYNFTMAKVNSICTTALRNFELRQDYIAKSKTVIVRKTDTEVFVIKDNVNLLLKEAPIEVLYGAFTNNSASYNYDYLLDNKDKFVKDYHDHIASVDKANEVAITKVYKEIVTTKVNAYIKQHELCSADLVNASVINGISDVWNGRFEGVAGYSTLTVSNLVDFIEDIFAFIIYGSSMFRNYKKHFKDRDAKSNDIERADTIKSKQLTYLIIITEALYERHISK